MEFTLEGIILFLPYFVLTIIVHIFNKMKDVVDMPNYRIN